VDEKHDRSNWLLLLIAGVLMVAACLLSYNFILPTFQQPDMPLPEEIATPQSPAEAWDRIQAAGKLVVGTSADYPPFEYYNEQFQIDGFDPALMVMIGKLGVQIELQDFAFDGLGPALAIGQVDAPDFNDFDQP
jgi:polar amino acid transport system substrate-binding protein